MGFKDLLVFEGFWTVKMPLGFGFIFQNLLLWKIKRGRVSWAWGRFFERKYAIAR